MTNYRIYLYQGAVCEPNKYINESPIYDTDCYQWVSDPDVVKNVMKFIEDNNYKTDGYIRWIGPIEECYHIDFGSWNTFACVCPIRKGE